MLEHTTLGIHGRFPELLVTHLTQTFVTLRLDLFLVAVAVSLDEVVTLLVVPAVLLRCALRAQVQRSHSDVEVTLLNHFLHVAEEQRHDQRGDMRTIDIGIRHDDYFVVADLAQVQCLRVVFRAESDAQSGEDVTHLFALEHLVLHRFLHVQDLSAQRQDSLVLTVTTGLGCTAG